MHALNLGIPAHASVTILLLGAHSDDIEIGCGGTVLRLASQYPKARFVYVVLSANPARAVEARNGFEAMLADAKSKEFEAQQFRDGFFPYCGGEVKDYFESLKHRYRPHCIFTHCLADRHQDHRLVSELTWNTFRDHAIFEYEIPKYDGDLGTPNLFFPLSMKVVEQKIDVLMRCFPSQRGHAWFTRETFAGLMRLRGMECNAAEGHAEAFVCRKVVL